MNILVVQAIIVSILSSFYVESIQTLSPTLEEPYSYEKIEIMAKFLLDKTNVRPVIGIITGSGLGSLADRLDSKLEILYKSIPDFPLCTVSGHNGSLVFGYLGSVPTVCMKGRIHVYEGYPPWKVTVPVRVMKLLGVKTLILTNAAGGISSTLKEGDLMVLRDHISLPTLSGFSPLVGPNDVRWGPRFPMITGAYDTELRLKFIQAARKLKLAGNVHEGVYAYIIGPEFESEAEVRMLAKLGADAIGMSTVPEAIVARHCGLKVLAVSLITDLVNKETSHTEVLKVSRSRAFDFGAILAELMNTPASKNSTNVKLTPSWVSHL